MIEIKFVDGESETWELKDSKDWWFYNQKTECFEIKTIEGLIWYPKGFVRSIRHIEV